MNYEIILPSQPKIVKEDGSLGIYEIDGLYPGYGHTLGNSLRRIILSSLPGNAITKVKIKGVEHEFSAIQGVKEDVITILLNIKKIRMKSTTEEPLTINLKAKGVKTVYAKDLDIPGQIEILNPDQIIATLTDKTSDLEIEMVSEKGLGFVSKEALHKDRVEIGAITLNAIFSPIKRANYEVENMRVGDRTDFNRLRMIVETDGTINPREALEKSIGTMINQLKAVVGFKDDEPKEVEPREESKEESDSKQEIKEIDTELLKTRVDSLNLSQRTIKSLTAANIRTLGGLARKRESDIMDVDGLGAKGMQEIKKMLAEYGITLRQ
jgi:DNA-directed RNA polymerase subunit alpha